VRPIAFLPLALAPLFPLAFALAHCGSDAVGIDACRQIEEARCEAARTCGLPRTGTPPGSVTDEQVESCKLFYRDQCLHGIQNDQTETTEADTQQCVAAVNAATACAQSGAADMSACPGAPLATGADPAVAPCTIITSAVEKLAACAFVVRPNVPDAGTTTPDASATGDAATD